MWRRLAVLPLRTLTAFKTFNRFASLKSNVSKIALLMSVSAVVDFTEQETLAQQLKLANSNNDDAMRNLLRTLNACIEEICEQYQHCLAKQIEITVMCTRLSPVGEHWDDLTKYRVEAGDLRREFEKYNQLVERIGQIIHRRRNIATDKDDDVLADYDRLKSFVMQKSEENVYWERKLLDVNKESILNTAK